MPAAAGDFPIAIIFIGGGVALAVALVSLVLMSTFGGEKRTRNRRLAAVVERVKVDDDRDAESGGVRIFARDSDAKGLDRIVLKVLPNPDLLRARLRQAGLSISLTNYFLVGTGVLTAVTVGLWQLTPLPLIACAMFGFAAGLGGPHMVVGILISRRREKFVGLFPEGIDLMVRGLKSGLPITESVKTVGSEIDDPIGIEFRRVVDDMTFGRTLEDGLWRAADRIASAEFRFFVVCISVQRETGGNLGETLENLADILRKRRQAKLKVKAMSAEAKFSSILIGSLPFIMMGIIQLVNPGYLAPLFTDKRGIIMLVLGATWLLAGIGIMARMSKFEI
ncbi:MAG: type II secretion system F family protein [Alphaproteobacteria bacterium]